MPDGTQKPADAKAAEATAAALVALYPPSAQLDALAKLREPFPETAIGQKPQETKRQKETREAAQNKGDWPSICAKCGQRHHKDALHLDYVGHAALTDRLLSVDPLWQWEPFALRDGLPALDQTGGLWIRLTVAGMTRPGYGSVEHGKTGGNAIKELIGDALRNAGMRFGMALELWHKGELRPPEPVDDGPSAACRACLSGMTICRDEASLMAWGETNKAAIGDLPDDEQKLVRKTFGEALTGFRAHTQSQKPKDDGAKTQTQQRRAAPSRSQQGPKASFEETETARINAAETQEALDAWSDEMGDALQQVSQEVYDRIFAAWQARSDTLAAFPDDR